MSNDRIFHPGPPLDIGGLADGALRPPGIVCSSLSKARVQTFHHVRLKPC